MRPAARRPAGHNIARVAALRAGLPVTTAGLTVNRFCNSGLQAIVQAAHMVVHEGVDAAIGGGVESITMMQRDNSPNPWVDRASPGVYMVMGETAEVVAKRYGISREAQDEYALVSQQRTARAQQRRASSTASSRRCRSRRAILDKKTRREDRRGARDWSIATSATVPTRRSKGSRSCRRCSTRRADAAA